MNQLDLAKVVQLPPTLQLLSQCAERLYSRGYCDIEDLPQERQQQQPLQLQRQQEDDVGLLLQAKSSSAPVGKRDDLSWLTVKTKAFEKPYRYIRVALKILDSFTYLCPLLPI